MKNGAAEKKGNQKSGTKACDNQSQANTSKTPDKRTGKKQKDLQFQRLNTWWKTKITRKKKPLFIFGF